ncbi:MAG: hypothetical protein IKL47_07830 [Clostridia bacterium]|nr:hypothetical protein [Clostridia bacterium]
MDIKDESQIPEPRGLDRLYSEVERNGKTVERCFSDLSREEQKKYLDVLNNEVLKNVCYELSNTIRIIAEFFRFSCFYDEA